MNADDGLNDRRIFQMLKFFGEVNFESGHHFVRVIFWALYQNAALIRRH